MTERAAFVRAWHAWRRTPLPVAHFRGGRARAPAYEVELVLDHLADAVEADGRGAMEGRAWDFAAICARDLATLEKAAALLERSPLPPAEREPYRAWIHRSRAVLHALRAWRGGVNDPTSANP